MGLLSLGTPLSWDEAKKYADYVRYHGISQFIAIWNRVKARKNDRLLWGDEIEGSVVHLDHDAQVARVTLRANEVLAMFEHDTEKDPDMTNSTWHPEYGRYMVEGTPGRPYGSTVLDLLTVEENMRRRRLRVSKFLKPDEAMALVTAFPRLGCPDFLFPPHLLPNPRHGATRSIFVPDQIINPHARFPTLTANIRRRRGAKVQINVPVFHDVNTPVPYREPAPESLLSFLGVAGGTLPELLPDIALEDHVYMDAMAFGMGNSCLQVTFQACTVQEARRLYDQLTPVTPIMLALSAATPILRGHLVDTDVRWNVISASVDDRTDEERGLKPLEHNRFRIPKSRYSSTNMYLSTGPGYAEAGELAVPGTQTLAAKNVDSNGDVEGTDSFKPKYNDLDFPYDKEIYRRLLDNGVDDLMARHIATIFIRDPLVVYEEKLEQDDSRDSDHFENLQSTNWQTMRFKPPPPSNPSIGWRVEFRPMEIQLTDFENAAYSIFIVLLTRAILSYNLNLYIPISKVDANMEAAHARSAASEGRFWFRRNIFGQPPQRKESATPYVSPSLLPSIAPGIPDPEGYTTLPAPDDEDRYTSMTIDDILNGNAELGFPGLVPLVRGYVNGRADIDADTRKALFRYVDYISAKASGKLVTTATWIRQFVAAHPDYKRDSLVSQKVNYDLMCFVKRVGEEDEDALRDLAGCVGHFWKDSPWRGRPSPWANGHVRPNGDLSNCADGC
ncbi:glutamate-cysteine ligase-domain-containing protein [Hyaloraphidium curvatum]|nr:glutamate-cysteine ligase-domain-containing protein [Hyaloraphidium curvatum]